MARSTKADWLSGEGDLRTAEVSVRLSTDPDAEMKTVLVRGLAAAFSNQATSEATEMVQGPAGQTFRVNTEKLEVLKFVHGCTDPEFNIVDAQQIAEKYGPAFSAVVAKIDELSRITPAAIEETEARFQSERASAGGSGLGASDGPGNGRPVVGVRTGAGTGHDAD